MVSIELAIGFLVVISLTTCLAGLLLVGVVQANCQRVSTELARQYARGDDQAVTRVRAEAPKGAKIEINQQADGVKVQVSAPIQVFGLGQLEVSAQAWSRWEVEP